MIHFLASKPGENGMRGSDGRTGSLFSYVDVETRVRGDHPLRPIRAVANAALADLSGDFDALYTGFGRPSIAPEKLLRAMLLQAFYGIRSERQLMERMEFDLLFRWFVGLGVDDPAWNHSSFSKNRERLLKGEIAAKFLRAVLAQPKVKRLLSSDHFSVDGTLIEAWASTKSFRRKDGGDGGPSGPGRNAERDFHGEARSNETHESTTDPDARLYRKGDGQPSRLCYLGHALMENRHGLVVDGHLTKTGKRRKTLIDRRTLRHAGYAVSQRCRKRIEEVFGWIKSAAGLARVKLRGQAKVETAFTLALAAYNLIRLPRLLAEASP